MSSASTDDVLNNNNVGPILIAGDVADAVVEAAEMDNPEKEIVVDDKLAYLRVSAIDEMIITRESIEECLGRPFLMQELEVSLSSFAGRIDSSSEQIRFYFEKHV
jgi:toluene monooxygenase system protein D